MNLVPGDPPYSACSAQGQVSCAHNVFSKKDIENAVGLTSNVMAPELHGHIFLFGATALQLKQEPPSADEDHRV